MANRDTITKTIKVDVNSATANIDKLEKSLDKTKNTNEQLQQSVSQTPATIEQMGKSFEETAQQAETFRQKTDAVQKVSQGLVGAFSMAVGSIAMFGSESEKLTEIMTKLSSVMVMTNGLKQLGEGFKGLSDYIKIASKEGKLFNTVMKASVIGLIVAAIGYLIANFDELRKKFAIVNTVAEKATEIWKGLKGVFSNIVPVITNLGKTIGLALISPIRTIIDGYEGLGKIIKAVFEGDFKSIPTLAKNALADIKENFRDVSDAAKDMAGEIKKGYEEGLNAVEVKGLTDEEKKALEEKRKQILSDQATLREELRRVLLDEKQKEYDDLELWNKKAREQAHNNNELLLQADEEYRKRKLALDEKYAQIEADEEAKRLADELAKAQENLDTQSARNSFINRNDEMAYLEEQLKIETEKLNLIDAETAAWYNQANAIENLKSKINDLNLKALNDEQQRLVEDIETNVGRVNTLAEGIGGIFDAVMSGMDENSEAYKGLAITQTIITTLVGMMNALAGLFTTKSGPWDIALAAVQAASILAGGIATVSQIANANENTNLSSASASITSGARVSENAVQGVMGAGMESMPQAIPNSQSDADNKVYVLTTDINRQQGNLSRKRSEVRF